MNEHPDPTGAPMHPVPGTTATATASGDDASWPSFGLVLEEVRVLGGLSRGAALPIESVLTVGSDPACDLVLADPLVAPQEARLERPAASGGPLTVQWLAPVPGDEEDASLATAVVRTGEVALGEVFVVSGVSLQYCRSDAPWDYALLPPTVAPPEAPVPASRIAAAKRPAARRHWTRAAVLAIAILLVPAAIALAAFLYLRQEARDEAAERSRKAAAAQQRAPTPAQIARQLQTDFDGRGLGMVKVEARSDAIYIAGAVPGDRQEEFEGVVERTRALHRRMRFRIDGAAGAPAGPIVDIVALVGGVAPSALLGDGQQLYIGSEIQGFRLAGIEAGCAVFRAVDGPTQIQRCLAGEKKP